MARLVACKRCGELYQQRFYGQHRRTDNHLIAIKYRQARYGGRTTNCPICSQDYPNGTYSVHVWETAHMEKTSHGRRQIRRTDGIELLVKRDDFVSNAIKAGQSYGEIAGQLGISRQRVHQICQTLGIVSRPTRPSAHTTVARTCFYDGLIYSSWPLHAGSATHLAAVNEFKDRVGRVRRSEA